MIPAWVWTNETFALVNAVWTLLVLLFLYWASGRLRKRETAVNEVNPLSSLTPPAETHSKADRYAVYADCTGGTGIEKDPLGDLVLYTDYIRGLELAEEFRQTNVDALNRHWLAVTRRIRDEYAAKRKLPDVVAMAIGAGMCAVFPWVTLWMGYPLAVVGVVGMGMPPVLFLWFLFLGARTAVMGKR